MRAIYSAFSHINLERYDSNDKTWYLQLPNDEIIKSTPRIVENYDNLVMDIAKILHNNRNFVLFYRGQQKEYKTNKEKATILPSIYRNRDDSKRNMLKEKFRLLKSKSDDLMTRLSKDKSSRSETMIIRKYPEITWSILQHYEVCDTPLIDITHSLHVACSFALKNSNKEGGIVYVFGFPWQTDAIGYNSYDELVNIRLLSVCPPFAKRPFFQEGYLAGPFPNYNLDDTRRIPQFDFSRRLIAKFQIKNSEKFWGAGFNKIPREKLYPADDPIQDLIKN